MKLYKKSFWVSCIATFIAFFSVTYLSCKKKEQEVVANACTNVVCYNSGTCIEGACHCISGFEGTKCEINSRDRYVGVWQIMETITGSSEVVNKNKTRTYDLTIEKQEGNNIALLFDNFMGNTSYNNILVFTGKKYDKDSKQFYNDVPTKFAFNHLQNIPGTYITINTGDGTINDLGVFISGSYTLQYLENSKVVFDTVSFSGEHIP